jgi:ribosomal protein S18 acetylase RimI-like enzyme
MAAPAVLSFRSATEEDRSRLANLLHFETHVHRHLDWRRPLDWLGSSPFLISETAGRLSATLACPQDPPGVAWVRLFAVVTRVDINEAWELLWPAAEEQLRALGAVESAAIPLHDWFRKLLSGSGFHHTHNVVVLDWRAAPVEPLDSSVRIRPMNWEDLVAVQAVDQAAFAPLWQNSVAALEQAYRQAGFATVIEDEGQIVAYQLSTLSTQGLHLARLATHPSMQGKGLALRLVRDLQANVLQRHEGRLTVNTQDNNKPSLGLYKKLGFQLTNECFPVYQRALR